MRQTLAHGVALTVVLGFGPAASPAADEPMAVAIVDGTPIKSDALDAQVQGELRELRQRESQARRRGLNELIGQVLFEREAAARGLSLEDFLKAEITDKSRVTPAEARAFYIANRARFDRIGEAEAIQRIIEGLGERRETDRRTALARELRNKYPVEVLLEPFRVDVGTGDGPVRGNPDAPITIVEFSDFQCPYCVRARPTIARVRDTYGDQVRFAFRHYPLAFHQQAPKAGEAVACAGDQDRFWDMHDRLWQNPGQIQPSALKGHAAALGLDLEAFGQCLDSGRYASLVKRDTEEGARLGVSATPAFFVNGRLLVGAVPFDTFVQLIDEELTLASRKPVGASDAR
jgi:predicted DsbA family dithiol-disulfide isomerase